MSISRVKTIITKETTRDVLTIVTMGYLAFGTQILWLGYFQDDWNFVYFSSTSGARGIFEFLVADGRPGASWVYWAGFFLLGYKPGGWQFFSISLRILIAINFWFVLRNLWPSQRFGNLIVSVIFLTYPFFTLQPL